MLKGNKLVGSIPKELGMMYRMSEWYTHIPRIWMGRLNPQFILLLLGWPIHISVVHNYS